MTSSFTKDPVAVLDFSFDWSAWLASGETISTHTVTPSSGITLDSSSESGGIVTAWLSGGTVDANYSVACRITTSAGRTDERTIRVMVRDR